MMYDAQYMHNLVKFFLHHFSLKTVSKIKPESLGNIICFYCLENVQLIHRLWVSKKCQRKNPRYCPFRR
jgi:hypothetical protein